MSEPPVGWNPPQPQTAHRRPIDPAARPTERFRAVLAGVEDPVLASIEMLPARIAHAASQVLGFELGLSVFSSDFRVPLGASGPAACDAERLQFTYGEGPCLQAHTTGTITRANARTIEARWPLFYADLIGRTPYRSVVALPLSRVGPDGGGAMDLYFSDPYAADQVDLAAAVEVAADISATLRRESGAGDTGRPGPGWLHGPAALERMAVWAAVGMVNAELQIHNDDALALIRAHAFAHDATLDAAARWLLTREVSAASLRP